MLDHEDAIAAARIDRHGERAALRHGSTSKASSLEARSLTVTINAVAPTGATGGITICAAVPEYATTIARTIGGSIPMSTSPAALAQSPRAPHRRRPAISTVAFRAAAGGVALSRCGPPSSAHPHTAAHPSPARRLY